MEQCVERRLVSNTAPLWRFEERRESWRIFDGQMVIASNISCVEHLNSRDYLFMSLMFALSLSLSAVENIAHCEFAYLRDLLIR